MKTKKVIFVIATFCIGMMIELTSCKKEDVGIKSNSEGALYDSLQHNYGWPNGMVHLNQLDSVK